jgi:hypothetical protein
MGSASLRDRVAMVSLLRFFHLRHFRLLLSGVCTHEFDQARCLVIFLKMLSDSIKYVSITDSNTRADLNISLSKFVTSGSSVVAVIFVLSFVSIMYLRQSHLSNTKALNNPWPYNRVFLKRLHNWSISQIRLLSTFLPGFFVGLSWKKISGIYY